jgi:polysaccharide export outer membrane protein
MTMRILLLAFLLAAVPAAGETPQGAAAVPAASSASTSDYLLGPGDIIRVDVLDEQQLSKGGLKIDLDGSFDYPYLGKVQAKGLTKNQLKTRIETGLINGKFVNMPIVSVDIEQARARSIMVTGEVRQQGKMTMTVGMTLLDAVSQAGILTTAGSQLKLQRKVLGADGTPTGATVDQFYNISDILDLGAPASLEMHEDDRIAVAKAEKFFVSGQVRTTGEQTWEPGLTVREAILRAGGIGEKGSDRRISIIRIVNGKEKRIKAKWDTLVEKDDVIEVGQRLL